MEERIDPEEHKKTIVFRKRRGVEIPVDFGDYQIIEEIGCGGMGVIYKAQHKKLNAIRALKVLDPILSRDEDCVRIFRREAQLAAQLKHPNIVIIHDTGEFAGFHFIAMEYIGGKTLADYHRVSVSAALAIVGKICDALEHAHNQEFVYERKTEIGLIHRDIKPGNIMIEEGGEVKLMDFGIARCTRLADQTRPGEIKGTEHYMSPEQLTGALDINLQTDIYSLGLVLYKLLSGRDAFRGLSREEYEHLDKLDKSIPKEVVGIVDRALSYNREDRFASAFEMKLEIEKNLAPYRHQDRKQLIIEGLSEPVSPPVTPNGGPSVLKWLLGIFGSIVIVFLLYTGISSWFRWISKGKAETAVSDLRERIGVTQGTYEALNLAGVSVLMSEAEDSLYSENFRSARSLCDSGSGIIQREVGNYRDSVWTNYTNVEARLGKIGDQEAKDEINDQYVKAAKERFDCEDYDSTGALLALASQRIDRSLRQRQKTSDTQKLSKGGLTITCWINSMPVRCDIFIDRKPTGRQAPAREDLTEGKHEITVTYGDIERSQVVEIKTGTEQELKFQLKH